jgi:hypothetical protein
MQKAANWASIAASIIAAIALLTGLGQFIVTQRLSHKNLELQAETLKTEREMKAIELFVKFNEMEQEVATKPPPRRGDAAFWRYSALLSITESVFTLTKGDLSWDVTVAWMLDTQRPFLSQTPFNCKMFAPLFLDRMKLTVPELRCL